MANEGTAGYLDGDALILRELLKKSLDPNTANEASESLKSVLLKPVAVRFLLLNLEKDPEAEIRQLAAVLLRRRVLKAWVDLPAELQSYMKECLLNRITSEPIHSVRISICHVVSAVGKVSMDTWGKTLCLFLFECSLSTQAESREAAVTVFASLLDAAGTSMRPYFPELVSLFERGLKDSANAGVCLGSLKGVQSLGMCCETTVDYSILRPVLVPMTQLIENVIDDSEDTVQLGMEILNDMIESMDVFEAEDIPHMVRFMLRIAAKKDLDCGIRNQALHFIHWAGKNKPKSLYKNNLVPEILDVVIEMGAEEEPKDIDEDELSAHRIASQCLDSLALNLPNKYVYFPAISKLSPYIRSTEPLKKKAALVLVGIMSEGCEQEMRYRLPDILPSVMSSFEDPNPEVQAAAAVCFSQLADYLQPEIVSCHAEAMKHLLTLIDSPHQKTQEKVCNALEVFCDQLSSEDLRQYLPHIMPKLVQTLTKASSTAVQENCLGAIGAVASSAEHEFRDYANDSLLLLKNILSVDDSSPEIITVKGKATEVVGYVAKAMGSGKFAPFCDGFVQLVVTNVEAFDNHDIRRFSFNFFSNLVACLKEEYHPYVQQTMVYVFASLFSSEGVESSKDESEPADAIDSDAEDDAKEFNVRTGYLEELECALVCLRSLWDECGIHCMKYIEKTTEAIEALYQHFNSDIRELIPSLMVAVLTAVHKNFPTEAADYTPGIPVKQPYLHQHTIKLWEEKFCTKFMELLDDDEKEVVTETCIILEDLFEELGPQLLESHITEIVNVISKLLENKHECQKYSEIDEDEESRLEEENLFNAVSSLISGVSKALGSQFVGIYSRIHPKIVALATHRESAAYRCIGLGCAASVFDSMGASAAPFVSSLVRSTVNGIKQKKDLDLQRNAVFAAGIFVQVCPDLASDGTVAELLNLLRPLFLCNRDDLSEREHLVLDNAIASVGRMILFLPDEKISFSDVVPLFLSKLPIVEDVDEVETSLKTLVHLFYKAAAQPYIEQDLVKFLSFTIEAVANEKYSIKEELKKQINEMNSSAIRLLGSSSAVVQELGQRFSSKPSSLNYMQSIFSSP